MSHHNKITVLFGKLMVLVLIVSAVSGLFSANALASGSDVTLSGNSLRDCAKGDVVNVFFEIPVEVYVCDFTALISYDAQLLEPVKTENFNGELVWVDTDVFAAGLASNVTQEGIRVAGATAQAGYKKGGKLLKISFRVMRNLPKAGTEVKVAFSVFHVAKTADATEECSVLVTAAKLAPGEKKQESNNNQSGNSGSANTEKPDESTNTTQPATEPATGSATESATEPVTEATDPSTDDEGTEPTQPNGGKTDSGDNPTIGLVLVGCGTAAVVLGIILFLLFKNRKRNDA